MSAEHPNQVRICGPGERTYTASFGAVQWVMPARHVPGLGHTDHIQMRCQGGLYARFTPESAAALARGIVEALAALPDFPECSGALAFIPGGDL